jgi:transposase
MDARTEIISQVERRRHWSIADKVRLLEATMQPGASVAAVADRHGVSRSLLFYWRKQAKVGLMPGVSPLTPVAAASFAPVVIAAERSLASRPPLKPCCGADARAGYMLEIVLGNGRVLKVDEGIAPDRLATLAAALDR